MKKLLKILILSSLAVFFTASIAGATTYSFGDKNHYWPTWYNNSPAPTGKLADDDRDQIGGPSVKFLDVWTNDGSKNLEKIVIGIGNDFGIDKYDPTALFIDNSGDFIWDYYVEGRGAEGSSASASLYNVSTLNISLFNPSPGNWPSTTQYKISSWPEWDISNPNSYREDHPAGILNPGTSIGAPGYIYDNTLEILVYDFTGLSGINIYLSDDPNDWLIGFTQVCANDVILGGNPVPEPATLLLLGSGLLGLAGIGRKKFKKS